MLTLLQNASVTFQYTTLKNHGKDYAMVIMVQSVGPKSTIAVMFKEIRSPFFFFYNDNSNMSAVEIQ